MTKPRKGKNPHIEESFDSFLKKQGIYGRVNTTATKRILARQLEKAMKQQNLTKAEMARRMKSSRAQLDRLLDPEMLSRNRVGAAKFAGRCQGGVNAAGCG